jgi:hypothetical protein
MNIKGGALEFDIIANNGQLNSALEESKKRVQGFSDATVEGGEKMELAYQEAAASIEKAFKDIDTMAGLHQGAINKLEKEYTELGEAAAAAFMNGTAKGDEEYRYLQQKQVAIKQEITTRKNLLTEVEATADALVKEEQRLNETKEATEKNTNAQITFRTQIRNVREELIRMEQAGLRGTERFSELQQELGRLQDAMDDATQQARVLANDEGAFQGIIQAMSGVSGAFSAAQGAVSLFAGENEDLQKIMLKVQSLMAITIGLQQVAVTLNKDSYFSLVTLGSIKQWWAGVVAKATVTEQANTTATIANTAAQTAQTTATATNTTTQVANTVATGAQATAAKAGTLANIGLAGAFRLVGVAIKSIPVFGWILAGISGIISLVSIFSSKAREAKKNQEEFNNEVAKIAGKPIAAINELSQGWNKLGNDLKAKEKFIKDQSDKFKELGVSIKNVEEAENLLVKNKTAFINSEIEKAKAMAMRAKAASLIEDAIKNQEKLEEAQAKPKVTRYYSMGQFGGMGSYEMDNPDIAKYEKKGQELNDKITDIYNKAADYEIAGVNALKEAGINATQEYAEGTVGAWEVAINKKQEALKELSDPEEYKKALKEFEGLQKTLDAITWGTKKTGSGGGGKKTDPYTEMLENRKKQYTQYYKWVNSKDEILQKAAKTEFAGLLAEGSSYLDFLQKQRERLLAISSRSPKETEKLKRLNDEIANETKDTVLGEFEKELQNQLAGARSISEMLNILEERRKRLAGDGSELDTNKAQILDKSQEDVAKKAEDETNRLISEYSNYLGKKIALELELTNDLQLLETRRAKAATETDKKAIDDIIKNRKAQYNEDKANLLYAGYEATRGIIDLAQDKALLSISNKAFMWESDRIKSELETQKQAAEKTLEELQKIHREAPTEAIALEIEKVKLKIEELNAELEKMPKAKFQEMLSGFQKITSALGNLDGTVGEIFSNISREVDNLKVAFDDTATKTDKVSAGIAAVVDIINMVSSASEERKRKEKEFYNAALAFAHEYTLTLNEQLRLHSELSDSVFITDYQAKINSGFEAMAESTSKYEEALAKLSEGKAKTGLRNAIDWGNVGSGAAAGAAAGAAIGSIVAPVIGTAIGAVVGGAIGAIAGLFGGKKKKETFGGLLEVFPELVDSTGNLNKALAQSLINTNQLDDKTKILVQNALDWAEAVEAANEQIREVVADLAGDLGNNIRNSIVEAWKAGEDASKRMFEVAGESLEKFIEQLVYSTLFSDVFKDFENELAASLDQRTGDGDVIDDYDRLMDRLNEREDLYVAALEAIRQRAKERGFDLWGNKNDNTDPTTTLSRAIKGASQESIDLLAGQTNAVRVNQIESIDIMRNQLLHLASIDAKVGVSNGFLKQIEENTRITASDPLRAQGITE